MTIEYICSNGACNTLKETNKKKPNTWAVHRNPDLFEQCPNCGQFMVPVDLIPPSRELDKQISFMFAGCVNAYECDGFDQYNADCEKGNVMTKCFHVIHQTQNSHQEELAECKDQLEHLTKSVQKLTGLVSNSGSDSEPH